MLSNRFILLYGGAQTSASSPVPAKPTLTITSATSVNTPTFDLTGDLAVDDVIRLQYSTASDFTGASTITDTVSSGEDAANLIGLAIGALADGTWYFRARIERPGIGDSLYSDTASETINTGAADPIAIWGVNLIGFWRADTGVTTSSGNVTAVADQSGNAMNLSNSGTVPFNATGFNGLPAFDFVAANDAGLKKASFAMGTGNEITVLVVGRMKSATASFGAAVSYGVGGGSDFNAAGSSAFIVRDSTNAAIATFNNSNGVTSAMTENADHWFGVVFEATVNKRHYVDNVAGSTGTAVADAFTDSGTLVIGNRYVSGAVGGGAWEGPIAAIIVVNRDPTVGELSDFDAWVFDTYGI